MILNQGFIRKFEAIPGVDDIRATTCATLRTIRDLCSKELPGWLGYGG